jgi:hypothetical protein
MLALAGDNHHTLAYRNSPDITDKYVIDAWRKRSGKDTIFDLPQDARRLPQVYLAVATHENKRRGEGNVRILKANSYG